MVLFLNIIIHASQQFAVNKTAVLAGNDFKCLDMINRRKSCADTADWISNNVFAVNHPEPMG